MEIRSRFVIENMAEERHYCNLDKPPPIMNFAGNHVIVKFERNVNPTTVYLRKEGFRLRYSFIDHPAEILVDDDNYSAGN